MMKFNVIEICAGVGGFGLGFEQYGQVLAAVEWDKAAAGVYKYNNPEVEMFCDLTEVRATDLPWDADDLVICGGTPCQAFSVAGKRGSLSDDRGNLALTFNNLCNAIDDLRLNAGKEPAIILWENVCGAINTDDNAFGCILGGMAGSDAPLVPVGEQRWTNAGVVVGPRRAVSFRVLDSQYFGVAQRRRRVFAVAIGGSRKWAAPEALVPFQKSLPRNPKKGEKSGEGSPGNAGSSATGASRDVAQGADVYNGEITGETAATVTSATGIANASGPKVMYETGQGYWQEGEHSGCLRAEGENRPSRPSNVVCSWNGDVTPKASEDVSVTLRSQQGGEGVGVAHGFYPTAGQDFSAFEEVSSTVTSATGIANASGPKVLEQKAYAFDSLSSNSMKSKNPDSGCNETDISKTLDTTTPEPSKNQGGIAIVAGPKVVAIPIHDQTTRYAGKRGDKQDGKGNGFGVGKDGDPIPTLTKGDKHAVCSWNGDVTPKASEDVSVTLRSQQGGEGVGVAHVAPALSASNNPSRSPQSSEVTQQIKAVYDATLTVRRLSSVECMRLQGWPDTHCDFKMELELDGNRWKATGKVVKQAEGPKYKQAGNGVTANVAAYIAGKLMDVLSK